MTWTYDPSLSTDKDLVRFYVGDTDTTDQLVVDEEILAILTDYSDPKLAAAVVCRSLAAKFARSTTYKVGDVSENCSDIAKFYNDLAAKLDPHGITEGTLLVLPSFGGLSLSEKDTLDADTDAVQPAFSKGMNDIPGGPDDGVRSDSDDSRVR